MVDTAGLRDTQERVESLGIEVARRYLKKADLILFCAEAGRALEEEEKGFVEEVFPIPVVLIRTKVDEMEGDRGGSAVDQEDVPSHQVKASVDLSVETGDGLEELKELLPSLAYGGLLDQRGDMPVITRARQSAGIRRALGEVMSFRAGLEEGLPAEVAATHLRPAETALEELLGVIPREEILDRLFREFCIGK